MEILTRMSGLIEKEFGVALVVRDSELKVTGDDPEAVDKASRTVKSLLTLIGSGETLTEQNVRYCIRMVGEDSEDKGTASLAGDVVCITSKGKPIKPKTLGQRTYCHEYQGEHHHHRGGACGHRQNLSGGGHGGRMPSGPSR